VADEYRNLHQAVSVYLLLPGSLDCLICLAACRCRHLPGTHPNLL